MDSFGFRLKEIRKQAHMTQSEVALQLQIDRTTYTNYESGKRFPDARTLCNLADIFGVSVDYLLNHKTTK